MSTQVPSKRGRPVSEASGDGKKDRARQQARLRKQRQRDKAAQAASRAPTAAQLEQSILVIEQFDHPDENIPTLSPSRVYNDDDINQGLDVDELPNVETIDDHLDLYGVTAPETKAALRILPETGLISTDTDEGASPGYAVEDDDGPSFDYFPLDGSHPSTPAPASPSTRSRTPDVLLPADVDIGPSPIQSPLAFRIRSPSGPPLGDSIDDGMDSDENTISSDNEEDEEEEEEAEREETDEAASEVDPVVAVAEMLQNHLEHDFRGCEPSEHSRADFEHFQDMERRRQYCRPLRHVCQDDDFPRVMNHPDLMTAGAYRAMEPPSAEQWARMFCGVDDTKLPSPVCLHTATTQVLTDNPAFDVDSFLGFASSLGFARRGIYWQAAPQQCRNLQTNVHTTIDVPRDAVDDDDQDVSRSVPTQLQKVPHFMMGTVAGAQYIGIYVLFPVLGFRGPRFKCLTHTQHKLWSDNIFLPSLKATYPMHYLQHFPRSFSHALRNSYAAQVESRLAKTASYQSQQALSYFLAPESLIDLWDNILDRINGSVATQVFTGAQLFFCAKGMKLHHKEIHHRPTLQSTLQKFLVTFDHIIDAEYVYLERCFIDIGKEVCPSTFVSHSQSLAEQDPHVLLWKRCCLKSHLNHLYRGSPPPKSDTKTQFYSVSMLFDAANLSSVTPRESTLRQGGLVYIQMYSSVKEVFDAAKTYPFHNEGLEELALDSMLRKAMCSRKRGTQRQLSVIEQAYLASKSRFNCAIQDSMRTSYGVREEYRCSLRLIGQLLRNFDTLETSNEDDDDERPSSAGFDVSYAWIFPTHVYLHFLLRNTNKFAVGFELLRAQSQAEGSLVSWERTKVMAMFLRCLRFSFAGHNLSREQVLWVGKVKQKARKTGQRTRVGLGFVNTLQRYGYAWLEPRMDWENLTFLPQFTDDIMFGDDWLQETYLRYGGPALDFFNGSQQIELALQWLGESEVTPTIQERLLNWMVHRTLQQFRADVLQSIREDLRQDLDDEVQEQIACGDIAFSYESLSSLCKPERMWVLRAQKSKKPKQLVRYLCGRDDGQLRQHWENKPYRSHITQCRQGLVSLPDGYMLRAIFDKKLRQCLFRWHWLLPYPHAYGLTDCAKGQRRWYAVQPLKTGMVDLSSLRGSDWKMASQCWMKGYPERFPDYLSWDKDQWIAWKARKTKGASGEDAQSDSEDNTVETRVVTTRRKVIRRGRDVDSPALE